MLDYLLDETCDIDAMSHRHLMRVRGLVSGPEETQKSQTKALYCLYPE